MDVAGDLRDRTNPELQVLRADALAAGRRAEAGAIAAEIAGRSRRYFTGEMLDIYDDSLSPRGTKERGLVHLDGDWHRTFHCWLVSPARGTLLVQRRALTKETFPGGLDVSVAGHYRAGEGLAEVCREGQEELGLDLPPEALVPLGQTLDASRHGILLDREAADMFILLTDAPSGSLRPDPAEVAEVLEVSVGAALELFRGEVPDAPALCYGSDGAPRPARIRADEFTTHVGRYYARVALQAERLANGLAPLCI